jgi:hypothetical protein
VGRQIEVRQMTTFYVVLIIVVALAAAVYLSRCRVRKAMRDVVALFRQHGATSPDDARSLEALGLAPRAFTESLFRLRDYRPHVLRLLAQANIVRNAGEDRFYLSEEALARSPLRKAAGIE